MRIFYIVSQLNPRNDEMSTMNETPCQHDYKRIAARQLLDRFKEFVIQEQHRIVTNWYSNEPQYVYKVFASLNELIRVPLDPEDATKYPDDKENFKLFNVRELLQHEIDGKWAYHLFNDIAKSRGCRCVTMNCDSQRGSIGIETQIGVDFGVDVAH